MNTLHPADALPEPNMPNPCGYYGGCGTLVCPTNCQSDQYPRIIHICNTTY